MRSRVAVRSNLRAISELAIARILGKVPRKLRRSAGRVYANEAYRHLNGLPMLKHGAVSTNRTVIEWVSREYSRYVETNNGDKAEMVLPATGSGDSGTEESVGTV